MWAEYQRKTEALNNDDTHVVKMSVGTVKQIVEETWKHGYNEGKMSTKNADAYVHTNAGTPHWLRDLLYKDGP